MQHPTRQLVTTARRACASLRLAVPMLVRDWITARFAVGVQIPTVRLVRTTLTWSRGRWLCAWEPKQTNCASGRKLHAPSLPGNCHVGDAMLISELAQGFGPTTLATR